MFSFASFWSSINCAFLYPLLFTFLINSIQFHHYKWQNPRFNFIRLTLFQSDIQIISCETHHIVYWEFVLIIHFFPKYLVSVLWLTSISCSQSSSLISETSKSLSSKRICQIFISRSFVNLDFLPDPILRIIIPFVLSFSKLLETVFLQNQIWKVFY